MAPLSVRVSGMQSARQEIPINFFLLLLNSFLFVVKEISQAPSVNANQHKRMVFLSGGIGEERRFAWCFRPHYGWLDV
jgi:hypothetical protein